MLPSGDYLVTTFLDSGTSALVRVEAGTGNRTRVLDFGEPGPLINGLTGVTVDDDGQALVLLASTASCIGEIYRVDPDHGQSTLVAQISAIHPWDIAVEPDGQLLVVGYRGGFCGPPGITQLYRVDPQSGNSTLVTDGANSRVAIVTTLIFGDGFESGDLSRCSSSSP